MAKANVAIWGPMYARGASYHAHKPGCADTRKRPYVNASEPPWYIDADSEREVWTEVYPPDNFDYDPDNEDDSAAYRGDVKIFPCVSLPKQ